MINIKCGSCGKIYSLNDDMAGKSGKCNCGYVFKINNNSQDNEIGDNINITQIIDFKYSSLFRFIFKPTFTAEIITKYNNKIKDFISIGILITYLITIILSTSKLNSISIVGILFFGIINFYIFNICIKLFGKLLGGAGSFRDINLISAYSMLVFIITNLLAILFSNITMLLNVIGALWFLVIYSKSLSKVQNFSETKVIANVIPVGIIYYIFIRIIIYTIILISSNLLIFGVQNNESNNYLTKTTVSSGSIETTSGILNMETNKNRKISIYTSNNLNYKFRDKYDAVYNFIGGMARVENNGKMGVIDTSGKEIIPIKYDFIDPFYNGYATIKKDGKYGTIDKLGNELFPFENLSEKPYFSEGLSAFSKNNKYGYIDITGKEIIPAKYDAAGDFNNSIALVYLNLRCGFIDKTGKEIIPIKYISCHGSSNGDVLVKDNSFKDLFIDKKGSINSINTDSIIIDSYLGMIEVFKDNKYGFIDVTGKEITPFIYDSIIEHNSEGIIAVVKNGKAGVIDITGKEITPFIYDSLFFMDEGLVKIIEGSKFGYMYKDGYIKWEN